MTDPGSITRRSAIAATLALSAVPVSTAHGAPRRGQPVPDFATRVWTSEFLNFDPLTNFRQAMRLQRSLIREDDILHWYHFIMFAVAPGRAPAPVVRWEGIELSHHRWLRPDLIRMHGHNLSFPRDLASGAFIDETLNPITGKRVKVPPMALTGDPGMFRGPKGTLPLDDKSGVFRPSYARIRRESDLVKIDGIRVPPATWPVTFVEVGYETARAANFDDPRQSWVPTEVSGAYVFPYPEWMEMDKAPGHMFAAWSGHKLRSVRQLPADFRAQAQAKRPDLLKVDLSAFDREVPVPPA